MSDNKSSGGLLVFVKNVFLLAAVLIAAFAVVGYFAGWIEFRHDDVKDKATIEINTRQVKSTAEDAVEQGKALIDKAADKVDEVTDDAVDERPENPTNEAESQSE